MHHSRSFTLTENVEPALISWMKKSNFVAACFKDDLNLYELKQKSREFFFQKLLSIRWINLNVQVGYLHQPRKKLRIIFLKTFSDFCYS